MGLIYPGIPIALALKLIDAFNIHYLIETGTYIGDTAFWASQTVDHVITIENSRYYWRLASNTYSHINNIQFLHGDSREVLPGLIPQLDSPTIYWLDAHWSGGETYGQHDECALLGELDAINSSTLENFILIDDARLFLSPPYRPYSADHWPDISSIIKILNTHAYKRYVVIIEDVIVAVPQYARELVIQYCQDVNTSNWEDHQKSQNRLLTSYLRQFKQHFAYFTRRLPKG